MLPCATLLHCSLGSKVSEARRDHCRSITLDRSPPVRALESTDWTKSPLMSGQQLLVWTTDCTKGRKQNRSSSSKCYVGLCFLIWLTSFPLAFLFFLESSKNRMIEGKDQARFQVQLHPIISYLSFLIPRRSSGLKPAPVFGAYRAELCLRLSVSQYFGTLRFAYTLQWSFEDCRKAGNK